MTVALALAVKAPAGYELPCADQPDLFFGTHGENSAQKSLREREAKAVCASCLVKDLCLEEALADYSAAGILGGLTDKERDRLRSGRKIAPLK